MATKSDNYALSNEIVGFEDGSLSLTLPMNHTIEHDHSVLMRDRDGSLGRERWVEHILIAKVACPALGDRSWLVVYRMSVTSTGNTKSRSYGAFNYARTMNEARQMSDDLIAGSKRMAEFIAAERPQQLALAAE